MKTINETLSTMWQSNEDFHARFLGRPADVKEACTAYLEEGLELTEAAFNNTVENVANEAADVLYTVIGVLRSRGISFDDFLIACQQVISKNDAKTHETHYINSQGKIQRKGRG